VEKQEKEEGGGEGVEEVRLQQGRFNIGIKAGARSSGINLFPGDPDPTFKQCFGSVTFWYESGTPRIRDSDHWIRILLFFVLDRQDANKKH
jgi:hypothetical protein